MRLRAGLAHELREPRKGFGVEPGEPQVQDPLGERGEHGLLEHGAQRELDLHRLPHPRDHLHRQERVPAQHEEVVPRPTRSTPSSSAQISASACSTLPTGASYSRAAYASPSGRGERPAVQLAVRRERERVQPHERRRHHVRRQRSARCARSASAPAVCLAHHVRHQPPVPRRVLARQHHGLAHARVLGQPRLDLARLDAEAADLHLEVDAPQELQLAVRRASRAQVARCGTAARPGSRAPNGSGTKRSRRQPGPVQVAARHARARRCTARPARPPAPARPRASST